ncbi:MAG: hypothetical protein KDB07_09555 [Planctomycetes bacterium]|nr:hypothetical protein [Planctomycetota bacterium]
MKLLLLALIFGLFTSFANAADAARTNPKETRSEYGDVSWYTNLDDAIKVAKEANKPIFLQFQEIPG